MPSKLVTDREKVSNAVVASGNTYAVEVGRDLKKAARALLEKGEEAPDYELVILLAARGLEAAVTRMVKADEAHLHQLRVEEVPRVARDEATARLYQRIVEIRGAIDGVYGSGASHKAGFGGNTSEDPVVLKRYADEVIPALKVVVLPAPRTKGTTVDVKAAATELEGLRDAVAARIKELSLASRQVQSTLAEKTDAIAAHDEQSSSAIDLLDSLYRQSGRTDIADRIRPTKRKATPSDTGDESEGDAGSSSTTTTNGNSAAPASPPVESKTDAAPAGKSAPTKPATKKAKAKRGARKTVSAGKRKKARRKRG